MEESNSALIIDPATSKEAQEKLFSRISLWLNKLLKEEGYVQWKNNQINQTILIGLIPNIKVPPYDDFSFSSKVEYEHLFVTGYFQVLSSLLHVRECEYYFRRYPFGGKNVSREAHLRTCCELSLAECSV